MSERPPLPPLAPAGCAGAAPALGGALADLARGPAGVGSVAVRGDGAWLITGDSGGITQLRKAS